MMLRVMLMMTLILMLGHLYKLGVISAATLKSLLGTPLYEGGTGLPMSHKVTYGKGFRNFHQTISEFKEVPLEAVGLITTLSLVAVKIQLSAKRCDSTAYMSTLKNKCATLEMM